MASTESAAQEQKKRTMEALERRFSVAKAEILQQQKKSKRLSEEKNEKEPQMVKIDGDVAASSSSSSSSSGKLIGAGLTPLLNTPSKKDGEANDPSYSRLSHSVHENLLSNNVKMSNRKGSVVDKILHELLQNGDSAQKYMQGSRSMKIDSWIPLDNYVKKQSRYAGARMRALQSHSKRSKSHMSMKQHKRCGSLDLPKDLHKFDIYKPMHDMWKGYMTELLKNVGKNQLAQFLLTADLHGAVIIVACCKIASFTGVSGIMIRETAETFGIITRDDKFRVVPKKASVFIFQVDSWKVTLHGDKLISRDLGL